MSFRISARLTSAVKEMRAFFSHATLLKREFSHPILVNTLAKQRISSFAQLANNVSRVAPFVYVEDNKKSFWKIFAVSLALSAVVGSQQSVLKAEPLPHKRRNLGFDEIRFEDLLNKAIDKISEAKNKDITLFVGPTGAGKTTIACYLKGDKFQRKMVKGIEQVVPQGSNAFLPSTPNPLLSDTIFAQMIGKICDTGGFFDTRQLDQLEETMIANLSSALAISTARSVEALAVVVSVNTLNVKKGDYFKELVEVLGAAILQPAAVGKNIVWVFSHIPNDRYSKDNLKELIKGFKALAESNLQVAQSKEFPASESAKIQAELNVYELLLDAFDRKDVFFITCIEEDKQDEKKALQQRLGLTERPRTYSPIDKTSFNLSGLAAGSSLSQMVFELVEKGRYLLNQKANIKEVLIKISQDMSRYEQGISSCKESIKKAAHMITNSKQSIEAFKKSIQENSKIKDEKNSEITKTEKRSIEIDEEIKKLNEEYEEALKGLLKVFGELGLGVALKPIMDSFSIGQDWFKELDKLLDKNPTLNLEGILGQVLNEGSKFVTGGIPVVALVRLGIKIHLLFTLAQKHSNLVTEKKSKEQQLAYLRDMVASQERLEKTNIESIKAIESQNSQDLILSLQKQKEELEGQKAKLSTEKEKQVTALQEVEDNIKSLQTRAETVKRVHNLISFGAEVEQFLKDFKVS